MTETKDDERRAALLTAEKQAEALLAEIEAAGFVAPGRSETEVEDDIGLLAEARFGVERHWHRRIVRAGANTLTTAWDYPPLRIIEPDDTVYVDLGPVFEEWEADIGRTYALGNDPAKNKLVADLPRVFARVQSHYTNSPEITGAELYAFALEAAADAGWAFGGAIAGHIVGEFSHMTLPGDRDLNRISPKNPTSMQSNDSIGRPKHWILEIHLVDHARTFGGFYERLL
ncbi:MAG TPA: M24 family metallopeptidase [Rhizomicrobium sp.]|jgi:Xaa-Pro aminopeptidase|nr:M24 family metallopeptidase [Rhizomicrobium sp.]